MKKYLQNYKNCIFCNSKNLIKEKKQFLLDNFYLRAIRSDLKITKNFLKKMKVYKCQNCQIIQNNPWFNEKISQKIFSNIYGQHNRSWSNLINFFKKKKLPDHGRLFEIINRNLNIQNYAEFNSPFMGLFLNFFSSEYKKNSFFYKKLFNSSIEYLSSRQLAGKSNIQKKLSEKKSKKNLELTISLKKKNLIKKKIKKFLYVDNSNLMWGLNDNYKSVNSRSLAIELFDVEIINLEKKIKKNKLDLFGIFHTLDHTLQPKKMLDIALNLSDLVIVYCHVDEKLEKQHLFSLTKNFLNNLIKFKIYTLDLTNLIDKEYKSKELYFLCSKDKNKIKNFKIY